MVFTLIASQYLATILMSVIILWVRRDLEIPITIHNLPIPLMFVLGLYVCVWLSFTHFAVYLAIGIVICLALLIKTLSDLKDETIRAEMGKWTGRAVIISLCSVLWWGQVVSLLAFAYANRNHPKLQP